MSKKHNVQKRPTQQPPEVTEIRIQTEEQAEEYLLKYLRDQKGYPGKITISAKLGRSVLFLHQKWGFTIRNPFNGGVETYEVHFGGVVWQTYPIKK